MKITPKFPSKFITIICGVWSIPFVLIMRVIAPFILIRVGTLRSDRIGHFVADAANQWIMLNSENNNVELYWLDVTCNKQWEKMIRRNFPVFNWVKYIDIWNKFIPGGKKHFRPSTKTGSRDVKGALNCSNIKMMQFLPVEDDIAKSWMRSKGWSDGEPFICLLVRDSAYFRSDDLHCESYDYSYHNYRDSDIDTYSKAMEWLANSGVWVFRMGKVMKSPVITNNNMIIDYAFCHKRNDLLDIWLFANCSLCISTGSGIDSVSDVYGSPLLWLNYLPLNDLLSWSNSLNYPKRLVWNDSNIPLNMREYLKHGYHDIKDYKNAKIDIINLTSDEITLVVQECWARLEDTFMETDDDTNQQNKFWKKMRQSTLFRSHHGFIHPKARLASTFLRSNPNFLR